MLRALPVATLAIVLAAGGALSDSNGEGTVGSGDPSVGFDPMAAARGYDPLAPAPHRDEAAELAPEFDNLPRGEGVALVFGICSSCHGLAIVKQQRMTEARWRYTLDWMVAEQGMPALPTEVKEQVIAYLSTHFSSER